MLQIISAPVAPAKWQKAWGPRIPAYVALVASALPAGVIPTDLEEEPVAGAVGSLARRPWPVRRHSVGQHCLSFGTADPFSFAGADVVRSSMQSGGAVEDLQSTLRGWAEIDSVDPHQVLSPTSNELRKRPISPEIGVVRSDNAAFLPPVGAEPVLLVIMPGPARPRFEPCFSSTAQLYMS